MVKNLHLSEVITTAVATDVHHSNNINTHRPSIVDPIEMTKLLSNITKSSLNKTTTSSTMDHSSRLRSFFMGRYRRTLCTSYHTGMFKRPNHVSSYIHHKKFHDLF